MKLLNEETASEADRSQQVLELLATKPMSSSDIAWRLRWTMDVTEAKLKTLSDRSVIKMTPDGLWATPDMYEASLDARARPGKTAPVTFCSANTTGTFEMSWKSIRPEGLDAFRIRSGHHHDPVESVRR